MNQKKRIVWNASTNLIRQFLLIIIALILNPFLYHGLGADGYGIIALIGMTGGILMLLDAGLAHAISRFISKHHANKNVEELNRVIVTSVCVYTLIGGLALAIVAILGLYFLDTLGVPSHLASETRSAFLLVAIALGVRFPGNAFEGVLRGMQRFDLSNSAILIEKIIYAALSFAGIGLFHCGVVGIAWALLAGALASQCLRVLFVIRIYDGIRIGPTLLSWNVLREMFAFGSMAFLTQLSSFMENTLTKGIVSAIFGTTLLGSFNFVIILAGLLRQTRLSITNVVMPVASKYEALEDNTRLKRLLIDGSRLLMSIIFPVGAWIAIMAGPLLTTWVGPELKDVAALLSLFACVEVLDASNGVGHMVLLGMGRAKFLGILYLLSSFIAITLLLVLAVNTNLGLYSAALGAGVGVLIKRFSIFVHMCRTLGVSTKDFLLSAMAPALFMTAAIGVFTWKLRDALPPSGWFTIGASAVSAAIIHVAVAWMLVLRNQERSQILAVARRIIG